MRDYSIEMYTRITGIHRVDSQHLFPRAAMANMGGHIFKVIGREYEGGLLSEVGFS